MTACQRGWLHACLSVLPGQYATCIGFGGEARGPGLVFTRQVWVAFVEGVKAGPAAR